MITLSIKHDPKLFYRIDVFQLKNLDKETREIVSSINSSWSDIEYLNYLFHKNFGNFDNDPEFDMTFSALLVMSDGFYVNLSTIYKLIEKLSKKYITVKQLFASHKQFFKKIQNIRNNIIIHKEKSGYKKPLAHLSHTDPSHVVENIIIAIDQQGNQNTYSAKPLEDIDLMYSLLIDLSDILKTENKNTK
jgi:hypothetical protein